MPTRVLTPYWSEGVQKLKVVPQPPQPLPHGLTPPTLNGDVHAVRCLAQLRSKDKPLEKYIYLYQLKHADVNMFYYLALHNLSEITPLIYTPTVGDACLEYSHIYRRPEGIFVSLEDKGNIRNVLSNWPNKEEARIAVVTDGSRILGLGDLGVNGMPIPIGKLSLYVACAGIRPSSTIPICLDLGTNNKTFLTDPLYLGQHRTRPENSTGEMDAFMDEFMAAVSEVFPKMLVQFEDFSTEHAFGYLERYRNKYPVFNDDIQGTGAVVLSGFRNAARLASAAPGGPPELEHRILFLGSGSAGVGVGRQLMTYFTTLGADVEVARRKLWFVDTQGLIYDKRGRLPEHKLYFSRPDYEGPPMKDLLDIIKYVRPTALLGLSTLHGAFTKEVIELMSELNPRPIIFPLSNPVSLSECTFEDAVTYSRGRVLFASGSPFSEFEYEGRTRYPGQGNNMYIFPGLGLGAILARAKRVTDEMIAAAALALADSLDEEEQKLEMVYPRIERIREISANIAARVVRAAQKDGVDGSTELRKASDDELLSWVKAKAWVPQI